GLEARRALPQRFNLASCRSEFVCELQLYVDFTAQRANLAPEALELAIASLLPRLLGLDLEIGKGALEADLIAQELDLAPEALSLATDLAIALGERCSKIPSLAADRLAHGLKNDFPSKFVSRRRRIRRWHTRVFDGLGYEPVGIAALAGELLLLQFVFAPISR